MNSSDLQSGAIDVGNLLFDGSRLWLVDWEAAFLNDRYADLAVGAFLAVTNDAEERTYLQEYFGAPPDSYQSARFFLMQQIAHVFYTLGLLLLGSMGGTPIDWSEPVPEFSEFHRRLWAGEINLGDKPTKILHGRIHWQLLHNVRQTGYDEALRIVADRH